MMKVFGLLWNSATDCLQISSLRKLIEECYVTKRCAVSDVV